MMETKSSSNFEILSMEQKRNGFHERYLSICKAKNLTPLPELKTRQKQSYVLDFHADRVKVDDWIAITSALKNDQTLTFLAIRLRRNNETIFEDLVTAKKAKSITATHPVIYSAFVLTEIVQSLEKLLKKNEILKTLIIEGLPLRGPYMTTFLKGLTHNKSITTISLSRSRIGDAACNQICSTVCHNLNIDTLNLSGCDLGTEGAKSIANLIRHQKIQRFSEAWAHSLRYRNVDADSFGGLKKIIINNNPMVTDEGLMPLTEILQEDVWIKDIEMMNCGLTDNGAMLIVNCLTINKTILNFNINGNPNVSDHLHRHISMKLCDGSDSGSDSNDSGVASTTISRQKLLEKVKYLEDQLELEIYRRKQAEQLTEKLQSQVVEFQQRLNIQNALKVPEGFTLIEESSLTKILKRNETKTARRVKHKIFTLKNTKTGLIMKPNVNYQNLDASESNDSAKEKNFFVERNIGDNIENNSENISRLNSCEQINGNDLIAMFAKKKPPQDVHLTETGIESFNPRNFFVKSENRVPPNSAEST